MVNGLLEVNWWPGQRDYSPAWITFPARPQVTVTVTFRQYNPMMNSQSAVKFMRFSNPNRGQLWKSPNGGWGWYWDSYQPTQPAAWLGICEQTCPAFARANNLPIIAENVANGQPHTLIFDYTAGQSMTITFDGTVVQPVNWAVDGYQTTIPSSGTAFTNGGSGTVDTFGIVEEYSPPTLNTGRMVVESVQIQ